MFHYRWAFDIDANNAKQKLVLHHDVTMENASLDPIANAVADRQISRLGVVGSNKKTAGFIEKNYIKFLSLLEEHFATSPYILGNRPSSSDFALYAQLEQLIKFDPTSRQIANNTSMRTVSWIDLRDDPSSLDDPEDANGGIDIKNGSNLYIIHI